VIYGKISLKIWASSANLSIMNQELTQELYRSFATPKFIWRRIVGVRSGSDVKFLFRAAGKVVGHLTDFSPQKGRQ